MNTFRKYSFNQVDIPPTYSSTETNPAVYDEEGNLISPETPVELTPGIYRTPQQEYEYQLSQIEPGCSIYSTKPLGPIVDIPGEYDQDGNIITPPTYHPGYAVDILWNGQPSTYLSQFEVWPSGLGVHTWWGFESQYEEARNMYKQNNP